MLRTSSYTILVELPDDAEDVLLVHGYTGAYDRVSRGVADFLRSREAKRAAKPLYGEWSPEPEPAGDEAVSDTTIDLLKDQDMRTDCSFQHLLRTMRRPIVDRIFVALSRIEERHGLDPQQTRRRNFGFFGGEPLLAANRPIATTCAHYTCNVYAPPPPPGG